jgi:hypothetical protein
MVSVTPIANGFHGYLGASVSPPKRADGTDSKEYGFGVSFYFTVWALLQSPLKGFQVGLPSTWIQPENKDVTVELCPVWTAVGKDAAAGDPDSVVQQGINFRDVFQNIEGGAGFWVYTQFPTKSPKYLILGIPDCYTTKIGPGWPFGDIVEGRIKALADDDMGLAQLSNRILVPPDGMPFAAGSEAKRLEVAWMALPLTDYDGYFHLQPKSAENQCLEWLSKDWFGRGPDHVVSAPPRACYVLIQSRAAARHSTPMKLEAVFS